MTLEDRHYKRMQELPHKDALKYGFVLDYWEKRDANLPGKFYTWRQLFAKLYGEELDGFVARMKEKQPG